jgi:lipid-binding SYLF domain-containing protein
MNLRTFALPAVAAIVLVGCNSSNTMTRAERLNALEDRADETIDAAMESDSGLERFFDTAAGYAVFPKIGKGGFIIGGSAGDGVVYQNDRVIGYTSISSGSIGAQIGGQSFSQIIFFEERTDLNRFKRGDFEFDANASAVAIKSGASARADYTKGLLVFVFGEKGLMAEASIGGQKFDYEAR